MVDTSLGVRTNEIRGADTSGIRIESSGGNFHPYHIQRLPLPRSASMPTQRPGGMRLRPSNKRPPQKASAEPTCWAPIKRHLSPPRCRSSRRPCGSSCQRFVPQERPYENQADPASTGDRLDHIHHPRRTVSKLLIAETAPKSMYVQMSHAAPKASQASRSDGTSTSPSPKPRPQVST